MAMALAHLPDILPHTPVVILGDNLDTVEAVNRALSNPPPARPSTYKQGTRDTAYTSLLAPLPLDQRPHTLYGKRACGLFLKMSRSSINVAPLPPTPPLLRE